MRKKILITGASGFLGTNVISRLSRYKSFEIYGLISRNNKKLKKFKNVRYFKNDISNAKLLNKSILGKINFNYVINFAGNIDHSNKTQTYKAHYYGLTNLIKAIGKKNIKLFIQIGSSLEYGRSKSPHMEKIKCNPVSNYGKAKLLSSKYIEKNIKNYIILRLYQVYGPYQKINRLVPIVINSCLKNSSFPCTDGNQFRDFLYVDDFTDLILKILSKKKINKGVYNVGSGKPMRVKNVIYSIKKLTKKGRPNFGKIKMRKDENKYLYPNINKIKKNFDWKPKTKILLGLRKSINFYAK